MTEHFLAPSELAVAMAGLDRPRHSVMLTSLSFASTGRPRQSHTKRGKDGCSGHGKPKVQTNGRTRLASLMVGFRAIQPTANTPTSVVDPFISSSRSQRHDMTHIYTLIGPRTIANTNISKDLDLDQLIYEHNLLRPRMYYAAGHSGHHFGMLNE